MKSRAPAVNRQKTIQILPLKNTVPTYTNLSDSNDQMSIAKPVACSVLAVAGPHTLDTYTWHMIPKLLTRCVMLLIAVVVGMIKATKSSMLSLITC